MDTGYAVVLHCLVEPFLFVDLELIVRLLFFSTIFFLKLNVLPGKPEENRGKEKKAYNQFQVNKKEWFDQTMKDNGVTRVQSTEADVNNFDLTTLGPLSFVLLDVDLYRPIKKAMKELYEVLSPGGIMVVDDCDESDVLWDGADQAYKEFVKEIGQPVEIKHRKLGVIRKPA